jgi:hypothetical protein
VLETCRELKSKINKYIEKVVQVGYLPEKREAMCHIKVNFILEHATKTQRWSGGIGLLFP